MAGAVQERYSPFLREVFCRVRTIVESAPESIRPVLNYHLGAIERSKGVRPAFLYACAQANSIDLDYNVVVGRAAILHLYHEMTLLVDDIFDHSRHRRGQLAAHCKFGKITTVCAAAWAKEIGIYLERERRESVEAICACAFELVDAEAFQWAARLHPKPTPMADWLRIAKGDTGALFRLAANFAGFDPDSSIVQTMYILYHGLDDVYDLFEVEKPGYAVIADIRDCIPTLPTCFTSEKTKEALINALPQSLEYLEGVLELGSREGGTKFAPFYDEFRAAHEKATRIVGKLVSRAEHDEEV